MQKFHSYRTVLAISSLAFSGSIWAADSAALQHRGDPTSSTTNGPLGRPVLGYVSQDAPLELRAIYGVPGSAVLSDPLVLPKGAARVHMAPGQGYALVELSNADPVVFPLGGSVAASITIAGALRQADFAVFSPKGQSAFLYSMALGRLQAVGGLPSAPVIAWEMDTSAFVEQPLDAAISDDAGTVLLTSAGMVYQLVQGNLPRQLVSVDGAAALTFLPNSNQAAVADRATGSVYLWQSPAGSAAQLASLTGVGEIRPSADGQGLWFTNPSAKAVSWLSVRTAELKSFTVPISPSKLDALPYQDMFLLASDPGRPAWFLFQQGGDALASFVPAVREKRPAVLGEEFHK